MQHDSQSGTSPTDLKEYRDSLACLDTRSFLHSILDTGSPFGELSVVSSFGADSGVLLHLIAGIVPDISIIFIDTGFHFGETLVYRDQLVAHLGLSRLHVVQVDPLSQKRSDARGTLHLHDPNQCCELRKVQVLNRALRAFSGWISGQKRFQTGERAGVDRLEWDATRKKWKFNPLADWSQEDLRGYQAKHQIPSHPLVSKGYASVGCAPCTTPVSLGEDTRAGRWRGSTKLECGLHARPDLIAVSAA